MLNWAQKLTTCAFLLTMAAFAQSSVDVDSIVSRMLQAQAEAKGRLRPYQATRQYQMFKGGEQKSEIMAEVNYLPPQQKSFNILKSTGGTAENVVKRTLEHEVIATKAPANYEISPWNYDFAYAGEEPCRDSHCWVLEIKAKRECKDLVNGRIWVDQRSNLIQRVQGELAKSPSWWVKKAHITVEYGDVEGMWLQTSSIADAKLRLVGDYRMISRDVDLRSERTVAARTAPPSSFRRKLAQGAVISNSGFFLPTHK